METQKKIGLVTLTLMLIVVTIIGLPNNPFWWFGLFAFDEPEDFVIIILLIGFLYYFLKPTKDIKNK